MQYIATKICQAGEIGIHGNLFGGTMLSWLDEAGASLACYLCSTPDMVTLKMNDVLFKKTVKTGDHIRLFGKVIRVGTSSITLTIEARRFLFDSREQEIVCSTEIIYVRINDQGKPLAIDQQMREEIA
ncbi:MAG: hotdog domain-containing protein [Thermodesulfobacteriota bacterium]|nr:hotdog domain-containing protein [Thermodesulfobacteriota bacterium]